MKRINELRQKSRHILDDAMVQLRQAHLAHYEAEGLEVARARLERLLELTFDCLENGDAGPLVEHAGAMARGRYSAGYALLEVQTAVNVLEEALWKRILASVAPDSVASALGQTTTALGMCKDYLARIYVDLAAARVHP